MPGEITSMSTIKTRRHTLTILIFTIAFCLSGNIYAQQKITPSEVYSGLEYSSKILDKLLEKMKAQNINLPISEENAIKPMHVYELHIAALGELYTYSIKNNRTPPPQPVSTPIKYSPSDVYSLTQLIINSVEDLHLDLIGNINVTNQKRQKKTPTDVYNILFELYYKLNRLNGKTKITPTEVYSHISRAQEDLKTTLLTLSKRFEEVDIDKKMLLTTATYGMHSQGESLSSFENGKKPRQVLEMAYEIRKKLNLLREKNNLSIIEIPEINKTNETKPIDVFLQTQFIIAELNLLKIPMEIRSITNQAKIFSKKTPSDVFHKMKHIDYMLDRLISVLYSG